MQKALDAFELFIHTHAMPDVETHELLGHCSDLRKEFQRSDFQIKRTIKDKLIVTNLLNRTIDELRRQHTAVETTNEELRFQKQLVEEQSEKLAEQLHMLEKSYAELEQFSYIASHDLKSPLRTISSFAGLLKRRYFVQLDAEANEFIDYIVKAADHMNEVIKDLLEYSGINKETVAETIDVGEVLSLVMQNLGTEVNESNAQIVFGELPVIIGLRTGMMQLFQNLVANAIKFRSDAPPLIAIEGQSLENAWQFHVKDNGLGLDETYSEKAFLPFQRISYLDRPGTGMGLAICKKIVMRHNGTIWYKSEMGKGTCFSFTIAKNIL